MTAPTRATTGGRAYLDLRKKARQDRRPVDELLQLYVLESFLARMPAAGAADRFVLKGGVLLAVFGERRPTRDIDLQTQSIANDPATVRTAITDIAATSLDDGVLFDTRTATAETIREEDQYQAVRVSMTAALATARPTFHVDVSVGDPISPEPQIVQLPRPPRRHRVLRPGPGSPRPRPRHHHPAPVHHRRVLPLRRRTRTPRLLTRRPRPPAPPGL